MIIATSLYLLTVAVLRAGWAAALYGFSAWPWASLAGFGGMLVCLSLLRG